MASRYELLQGMPIFGGVRADTLDFLLTHARTVTRCKGQFFFLENEPGNSLFVLESGQVAVLRTWEGRQHVLRLLEEGDCFGEMAIMDLLPRSASLLAQEDCSAIEISTADLYHLYKQDIEQFAVIQMNVARELSRRLRLADEQLFRARSESEQR
jgi:CRP/FNR family cyclic AMP-dependent transcriptional regulator